MKASIKEECGESLSRSSVSRVASRCAGEGLEKKERKHFQTDTFPSKKKTFRRWGKKQNNLSKS